MQIAALKFDMSITLANGVQIPLQSVFSRYKRTNERRKEEKAENERRKEKGEEEAEMRGERKKGENANCCS